jgi:lipopolysaccharide export system protein LptC
MMQNIFMKLQTSLMFFLSPLSVTATESFLSLQAPIQKFFLPMFTTEGQKQWEVEGKEATMNQLDRVAIQSMKMRIFSSKDAGDTWYVESPSAYVFTKSAVVEGRDRLLIQGHGFHASGYDWQWFGKKRHLSVHRQVEVHFNSQLQPQTSAQP